MRMASSSPLRYRKKTLLYGKKISGKVPVNKILPFETLTNIRIEKNRDDNSIVTLEHNGARVRLEIFVNLLVLADFLTRNSAASFHCCAYFR